MWSSTERARRVWHSGGPSAKYRRDKRVASASRQSDGSPGHPHPGAVGVQADVQRAGTAEVHTLVDRHPRRRDDETEVSEVAAEGSGGRTRGGVLDDAPDRERVARAPGAVALRPEQLQGR